MKHLSIYIVVTLLLFGSSKVTAQINCPNIEWMRFFSYSKFFSCLISNVNPDGSEIISGRYEGSPALGTYTFPAPNNFMDNDFIGRVDLAGNPLWVNVAKSFTYGGGASISSIQTSNQYIYTTVVFKWKTEFGGVVYENSQNSQEYNTLLVKLDTMGQVVESHLFNNIVFYLFHVDNSSNYYCSAPLFTPISINSQTFSSNGGTDVLIFKLNNQLQLQWEQQIGGTNDEDLSKFVTDTQNNIYITGNFKSPTLSLGSTQLSNTYSDSNNFYLAKINSNGIFQWAKNIDLSSAASSCTVGDITLDNNGNIYLSGVVKGAFSINNTAIASSPSNKFNSFLLKYTQNTNQFSSMLLTGGDNLGGRLLYLPDKNLLVLAGNIVNNDTVNFTTSNVIGNNTDFYLTGISLQQDEEKMTPEWVIHSNGNGSENAPNMVVKDLEENIYISGAYNILTGNGEFGGYSYPAIPGNSSTINSFQAKLAFLSREVTVDSGVLTAVQDSAMYQWLDCNNGMQPIPGATAQSFSPAQSGNYAVRVSNSLCSVVSDCINTTGISALQQLQQINIYPNPVQETLNLNHLPLGTQIAVFDVLGRKLFSGIAQESNMKIATRKWAPGLYVVELNQKGTKYFKKVVKE